MRKKLSLFLFLLIIFNIFSSNTLTFVYAENSGGSGGTVNLSDEIMNYIDSHSNFDLPCRAVNSTDKFRFDATTSKWTVRCGNRILFKCTDDELKEYLSSETSRTSLSHHINGCFSFIMSNLGIVVDTGSPISAGMYEYINSLPEATMNSYFSIDDSNNLKITADGVTALRGELKEYYYSSIGCYYFKSQGKSHYAISEIESKFEYLEDLNDTILRAKSCDYVFLSHGWRYMCFGFNKSDIDYLFFCNDADNYYPMVLCNSPDLAIKNNFFDCCTFLYSDWDTPEFNYDNENGFCRYDALGVYNGTNFVPVRSTDRACLDNFLSVAHDFPSSWDRYGLSLYSNDGSVPYIFKTYEAAYNYYNGSQTAYLSSEINKSGEELQISLDNIDENIQTKLDEVVDAINSNKSGLSSEDLQKLIDDTVAKKLGEISDNTGGIKDNTEEIKESLNNTNTKLDSLISVMSEQNEILLEILGVTEYIAYNTTKDDGSAYTMNDISTAFNSMFVSLKYAILYGVNNSGTKQASYAARSPDASVAVFAVYAADSGSGSDDTLDYRDGLFGKFPFSVPYQLYEWLQVLRCEPQVPKFTFDYGFMVGHDGPPDPDYALTFDFEKYQPFADVARSFFRLSFTLCFAVGVFKKFKGEV